MIRLVGDVDAKWKRFGVFRLRSMATYTVCVYGDQGTDGRADRHDIRACRVSPVLLVVLTT